MSAKLSHSRLAAGFSMLEMLAAGAILMIALVGLSTTAVTMAQNRGLSGAQATVGQLANEYLNEYVQLGYANLQVDGTGSMPILQQPIQTVVLGDGGTAGRTYYLTVHVTPASSSLVGNSAKLVEVTVSYNPPLGSAISQTSDAYVSQ